jgi:hypothetical protein
MDLLKLALAPWRANRKTDTLHLDGYGEIGLADLIGPKGGSYRGVRFPFTNDEAEFIALARNDLDVKMRRGWHTEKCTASADQWFVPQLVEFVLPQLMATAEKNKYGGGLDAAYQDLHDVGLLTKADRWYREHAEKE